MFHPTVWMGKYIRFFWKLNKVRKPPADFLWGVLLLLLGLLLFTAPLFFLLQILRIHSSIITLLLSIPLLKVSFSVKYLFKAANEVLTALEHEDLDKARELTAWHLVSRETATLTREQVVSAVIESVSENITDSFISPVFFFFLWGVPGAWAYRFINTSDAMIAYRNEEYEWGGKPTAWIDSTLNLIPARLTALGIGLSAGLLKGYSGSNSFTTMMKYHSETASPNAGWTMSAMAGALGVTLEKKGDYILTGGREKLSSRAIKDCLKLTSLSLVITLLILLFLYEGLIWALNTAV